MKKQTNPPELPAGKGAARRLSVFAKIKENARLDRLRYMLIFSLAPIIPNMKSTLGAGSSLILGMDQVFIMGIAYSLGMGLLFFIKNQGRIPLLARLVSLLSALLFILQGVLQKSALAPILSLLFSFSLGGCAGIALFGFSYALNDEERVLGAALTGLYSLVSHLVLSIPALIPWSGAIYLGIQVLVTALCLFGFQEADFTCPQAAPKKADKAFVMAIYFFFAHRAVMFFYSYLPNQAASPIVALSGILILLLSLTLFALLGHNLWHLCNLFFAGLTLAYALRFLLPGSAGALPANILHNFGFLGFIASYCLLGRAMASGASFARFRFVLLIIFLSSLLLHVAPGLISRLAPQALPEAGGVLTLLLLLGFVLLTPSVARETFYQEQQALPEAGETLSDSLSAFGLSAREKEITLLLLKGRLLKETAAELDISMDTVKFHTRNIYRKLDVHSRSELAALLRNQRD